MGYLFRVLWVSYLPEWLVSRPLRFVEALVLKAGVLKSGLFFWTLFAFLVFSYCHFRFRLSWKLRMHVVREHWVAQRLRVLRGWLAVVIECLSFVSNNSQWFISGILLLWEYVFKTICKRGPFVPDLYFRKVALCLIRVFFSCGIFFRSRSINLLQTMLIWVVKRKLRMLSRQHQILVDMNLVSVPGRVLHILLHDIRLPLLWLTSIRNDLVVDFLSSDVEVCVGLARLLLLELNLFRGLLERTISFILIIDALREMAEVGWLFLVKGLSCRIFSAALGALIVARQAICRGVVINLRSCDACVCRFLLLWEEAALPCLVHVCVGLICHVARFVSWSYLLIQWRKRGVELRLPLVHVVLSSRRPFSSLQLLLQLLNLLLVLTAQAIFIAKVDLLYLERFSPLEGLVHPRLLLLFDNLLRQLDFLGDHIRIIIL